MGGSAHTVSMGGYTLGGGHSPISRKFGAAVDNLLEVEMVTANGSLVYANASSTTVIDTESGTSTTTKNTDLFWALRGGGGSTFGIVTAFTYRLHIDSKMQFLQCYIPLYDNLYNPIAIDFMRRLYNLLGTTLAPEWGGYHIFSSASPAGVIDSRGSLYILMNHYGEYGSPSFNTILPIKKDLDQHCKIDNKTNFLDYTSMGTDPIYYSGYIFNTLMQPDSFTDAFYDDLAKIIYSKSQMPNGGCTGTLLGGIIFSHNNACFRCNIAITNFRVSHTCEIKISLRHKSKDCNDFMDHVDCVKKSDVYPQKMYSCSKNIRGI